MTLRPNGLRTTGSRDRYNDSFVDFLAKHGGSASRRRTRLLPRLNPAQQREMMDLTASAKDPVEAVQEYLHKQGFIDSGFKAASIEDALASRTSSRRRILRRSMSAFPREST